MKGQLQTSVTTFDADWPDEDIEAALAWRDYEASLCKGCGQPLDECMAVGADQDYDAEPVVCHACAANSRALSKFHQEGGESHGLFARLIRRR